MNKRDSLGFVEAFSSNSILIEDICHSYYMDFFGEHIKSRDEYEQILVKYDLNKLGLIETGFLLFGISEHIRKSKDRSILDKHFEIFTQMIDNSLRLLYKPQRTIFGEYDDAVNTSTLGIIYGGLLSANNYVKRDDISLCVRDIKDYVFKNNISGNILVNNSKYKCVSSDLLFSVMPFGLFSPDDLVLCEAVKIMENEFCFNGRIKRSKGTSKGDVISTLMLSWYYSEKKEFGKARMYLKSLEADEIKCLYEALLYLLITINLEGSGNSSEIFIDHKPFGNRNRYEPGNNERFPKYPAQGEIVEINVVAWPMESSLDLRLNLKINGVQELSHSGRYMENKSGTAWQWKVGPFNAGDHIEYCFESSSYTSCIYSFDIISQTIFKGLKSLNFDSGILHLYVKDSRGNNKKLVFAPMEGEMLYIGNDYPVFNKYKGAEFAEDEKHVLLSYGSSVLKIDKTNGELVLFCGGNEILSTSLDKLTSWCEDGNSRIYKTKCIFNSHDEEKFFGFGERFNSISQEGNSPDCYVYNQYKDQGIRTYIPVPFFISNKGYGIYIDSENFIQYDMRAVENGEYGFEIESDSLSVVIIPGKPREVVCKFTDITGKPKMIPKWAFGPWMSSNNWDNQSEVIKQAEHTKEYDIPASVLVIEAWSDEATYYIFNDAVYEEASGSEGFKYSSFRFPDYGRWPDPRGMVKYLHDNNLKCILWQIPVIKYMNNIHHIQKEMDEEYAINNKYCVLNSDGKPYRLPEGWFKGSLILDFSNPKAVEWWFGKREYLINEVKIDGFKTDGGECIFGDDIKFHSGKTGREMRNLYPNEYIGSYYNFINRNGSGEKICFSRAGYTGAQKFPAHWAGDEKSTFEAFRKSIIAGLTAGMSGISFWGWDIAGFSGEIPTAELYIRATQMAAFCPIMQYHAESKAEFNQDRTPWNIAQRTGDKRVVEIYRYYAQLRMNLLPYIYNEALKSSITGVPMMRALFMEYPGDKNCEEIEDEYMFGDDLLICPVIKEGRTGREIYLPEGKWAGFFDGKVYEGKRKMFVDSPIDMIPVFVKYNSIIPFNLNDSYMIPGRVSGRLNSYDNLCFRFFGDSIKDYVFRDDIGNVIYINVESNGNIDMKVDNSSIPVVLILNEPLKEVVVNKKTFNDHIFKVNGGLAAIKVSEVEVYE